MSAARVVRRAGVAASPRMRDERTAWWRGARAVVGTAFEAAFDVRASGLEHVPAEGAALVTYNHVSVLDPVAVALAAYDGRARTVRFLSVADVFDKPMLGALMRRLRQVPLRRGEGDRLALRTAIDALREGGLVGMSPEGTVGDGAVLQRGHTGAARIALTAGVPVVPVAVWGLQRRWPKAGPKLSRPLRVSVSVAFGEPVALEGDPESRDDVARETGRIMGALSRQVDLVRSSG